MTAAHGDAAAGVGRHDTRSAFRIEQHGHVDGIITSVLGGGLINQDVMARRLGDRDVDAPARGERRGEERGEARREERRSKRRCEGELSLIHI